MGSKTGQKTANFDPLFLPFPQMTSEIWRGKEKIQGMGDENSLSLFSALDSQCLIKVLSIFSGKSPKICWILE